MWIEIILLIVWYKDRLDSVHAYMWIEIVSSDTVTNRLHDSVHAYMWIEIADDQGGYMIVEIQFTPICGLKYKTSFHIHCNYDSVPTYMWIEIV